MGVRHQGPLTTYVGIERMGNPARDGENIKNTVYTVSNVSGWAGIFDLALRLTNPKGGNKCLIELE